MSIQVILAVLLIIVIAGAAGWFLANLIIPQSEIDEIDAIGRWAKEELDRRKAERSGNDDTRGGNRND